MIDEIKEYEELDEQDTALNKVNYESGMLIRKDMQKSMFKYSMVDRGLKEVNTMMEIKGQPTYDEYSSVGHMAEDDELIRVIESMSETLGEKF